MESVNQIKEALSARSRTATLDELRNEGRKRVRLIRAEHIAQMVSEAVHAAVEQSGLLGQEEVDGLIAKSREEFKGILREREQELERARANEQELVELKARFEELTGALARTRAELERAQADLEEAQQRADAQASAASAPPDPPQPSAAPVSNEMVMSLMQELANLKASVAVQQQNQQGQSAPAAAAAPDLSAAIEKLAGTLNERLDSFGKKMGISAAVDGDAPVDFGGLFKDEDESLESNMDNIQVKQKSGGGIAANLAKLKKLKGGG
ncbi:MAG TPA: hypothetical protein ENI87_13225 [bacterium]|nr:hypothetical protein [bacterium]